MYVNKYVLRGGHHVESETRGGWELLHAPQPERQYRTSAVVQLSGGASYVVQNDPEVPLQLTTGGPAFSPMCVVDCSAIEVCQDSLRNKLEYFLQFDCHVTTREHLGSVLLHSCSAGGDVDEDVCNFLAGYGCGAVFVVGERLGLPEGPHFYNSRGIFKAHRLWEDKQEAFILSTIASQNEKFSYDPLTANTGTGHSLALAIPSRLHSRETIEQPLAGIRIAVKDVFHVQGLHTGAGNRAYRSLYGIQQHTAPTVERALRKGCVLIGKAKTVEFAAIQEVCGDWVDYSYPFNCRADGYLVSTGSSTGSAAALAAYEFMDVTIGTDAGGSVRDPATVAGLFALRPTHDGEAEPHVVLACPRWHRSGYIARDLSLLSTFVKHAADIPYRSQSISRFGRILFPSDYWADDPAIHELCLDFVHGLADFANAETPEISVEKFWEETRPGGISDSFSEYYAATLMTLAASDYYEAFSDFRQEYKENFNRKPYVCPVTEWFWAIGRSKSTNDIREHERRVELHNEWIAQHILAVDDDVATIMVMPKFNTDHRDEYWGDPYDRGDQQNSNLFYSNLHASFAGLPDLIVPIGQVPFFSTRSGVEEQLPVSVSIVAAKGMDLKLMEFILSFLRHDGRPTAVLPGRTAFPTA